MILVCVIVVIMAFIIVAVYPMRKNGFRLTEMGGHETIEEALTNWIIYGHQAEASRSVW